MCYLYFLLYHFFLEEVGFPEAVLTFSFPWCSHLIWGNLSYFLTPCGRQQLFHTGYGVRPSLFGKRFFLALSLFGVFPWSLKLSFAPTY